MCNKCGITREKCSCNNRCAPKCDPCSKQPKIMYCGNSIDCLGVNKGDDLMRVVSKMGSWICEYISLEQSSTNISLTEIEPGGECINGGVTIIVTDSATDAVLSEYTICNAAPNPQTYLTVQETEPTEDCLSGGYTFLVRDYYTEEILEEHSICKSSPTAYYVNSQEVGQAQEVNIIAGTNTEITAILDQGIVNYNIDVTLSQDITYDEITNLIINGEVVPNRIYHITDRGIYITGMNDNSFFRHGIRYQRIIKGAYYSDGQTAPFRGVYNPRLHTTVAVGDKFIWGGRVHTATAPASTPITPLNEGRLGVNFVEDTSSIYYEEGQFLVEYDVRTDKISLQKDFYNNTILNVSLEGALSSVDIADWGQLAVGAGMRINNMFTSFVNNSMHNNVSVRGNYARNVSRNRFTSSCFDNQVKNIIGNTVHNIVGNVGEDILNNLVTNLSQNSAFEIINNNIGYASLRYNEVTRINNNSTTKTANSITEGTMIQNNVGVEISRNTSLYIMNNVVGFDVNDNEIASIQCNHALTVTGNTSIKEDNETTIHANICSDGIKDNRVSNQIFKNHVHQILNNIMCEILGNTGGGLSISENEACLINGNMIQEVVKSNKRCTIQHNFCISIEGNTTTDSMYLIDTNRCHNILNNNAIVNGVSIARNTNNGDIGTITSITNRSTSITDPPIDK